MVLLLGIHVSATTAAQSLGDIPRPEDLGAVDASPEPLNIDAPKNGEQVSTPFAVTGLAPPGARLELWIGDTLDRVFMADANGRFTSAVSQPAPGKKIWVHQVDGRGKRLQSSSVSVAWAGEATPLAPQAAIGGTTSGGDVIDVFSENDATQTSTVTGLPKVADLGDDSLGGAPTPPPPATGTFSEPLRMESTAVLVEENAPIVVLKAPPPRGLRGLGEAGLGLAGAGTIGFAGVLLGVGLGLGSGDPYAALFGGVIGGIAGWTAGIPVGVVLGGRIMDANGKWWAAILGEIVGIAAATAFTAAWANVFFDGIVPLVAFIAMPIAGSVIGYESTSDPSAAAAEVNKRGLQTLRPTLAPTRDGGFTVGVGLQF